MIRAALMRKLFTVPVRHLDLAAQLKVAQWRAGEDDS
jgi:hypothetical protein